MFFFNWNNPKKNTQDDSANGNSNTGSAAGSNAGSMSGSVSQMNTTPAVAPDKNPANSSMNSSFPTPTSAFGNTGVSRFSTNVDDSSNLGSSDTSASVFDTPVDDYVEAYTPPQHLRHTPWSDVAGDDVVPAPRIIDQSTDDFDPMPKIVSDISKSDDVQDSDRFNYQGSPFSDIKASQSPSTGSSDFGSRFTPNPVSQPAQEAQEAVAQPVSEPVSQPAPQAQSWQQPDQTQQAQLAQAAKQQDEPDFNPKVQRATVDSEPETDQSLESQNIFHLLGVEDGNDQEKESFLDELQQVVWEDFVENDVSLLLTESEYTDFKKIVDKKDIPNEEMQEEALVYLEKLVPDLEEILLEKAMQLKKDMVLERVMGMKEFYANNPDHLQVISQVERLFAQDKWKDGADMLNTLK